MTILLFDGMSVLKTTPMHLMNKENGIMLCFLKTIRSDVNKVVEFYKDEPLSAIVCWEGSIQSKQQLIPEYKGQRGPSSEAFRTARKNIQAMLPNLGITQAVHPDWEADDLLAWFSEDSERTVIKSGDHDLRQTVSMNNTLLQKDLGRKKGVKTRMKKLDGPPEMITLANFYVRTGYKTPADFLTAKILSGDKSDELTGMPGTGPATIQQYLYDPTMRADRRAKIDDFLASERGQYLRRVMKIPGPNFEGDKIRFTPHQRNAEVSQRLLSEANFTTTVKDFWTWWEPFSKLD